MKKLILVLGFLFLGLGVVGFFYGISTEPVNALLCLGLFGLFAVPCFALVGTMDRVDRQEEQLRELQEKLHRLEETRPAPATPAAADEPQRAVPAYKPEARHPWDCVRCGTVNKAGTTACAHCGAAYDEWRGTSR